MKGLVTIIASVILIGVALIAQKNSIAHESSKSMILISRVFISILFAVSIISLLVLCIGIPEAGVLRRIICGVLGIIVLCYYIRLLMTWISK